MPRFLPVLLLFAALTLRAQPQTFVAYSLAQGLPQSQVFATMQDSRGYMWFGTQGGGLCRFDGLDFQTYTTEDGLPSNYVYTLFEDPEHRIWVGTNAGLCFLKGKVFEKIPCVEGRALQVLSICQTEKGAIWLGTERGIFSCDPIAKTLKKLALPILPDKTAVWALLPTDKGIWIATDAGAFRTGQQPITLNTKNGLLSNAVRGFATSPDGHLWIATSGGGVAVFDEQQAKIATRYADPTWATCIQPDPSGKIWIGTSNNGVAVFNPADSTWTHTTEQQGFPHQYVRSMACDNTGNIWVGTSGGGVVKFLEGQAFTHFGASRGLAGNRVYALQRDSRGRLLMAVSLLGLQVLDSAGIQPFVRDSGWLSGIKSRSIAEDNFGRIWVGTAGKGLVVFDSSRMLEVPGLPSATIQKIEPGVPGEMWVATTAGIAKVSYGSPHNFLLQRFGKEEGLRGLIISTLHVDQQGSVWFSDQIGHFAQLMRGILNNSRQPYISLKEETDTLEQYLRIEQFCQQNKFEFTISLPKNIDPEELEIPPMLLQPFVENAVVHGVSHLRWPGKIELTFSLEAGLLTCSIRDNGIGREKAARLRQERKPGHQSVAIQVTRERLDALKNGANYEALLFEDIKDTAGEIIGTAVLVRILARLNY